MSSRMARGDSSIRKSQRECRLGRNWPASTGKVSSRE
jgi:hypothetical protein